MERKAEDNKEKEEKMTYEPPELIDLSGEVAKGECSFGSVPNGGCTAGVLN